jgi:hypothetical protein
LTLSQTAPRSGSFPRDQFDQYYEVRLAAKANDDTHKSMLRCLGSWRRGRPGARLSFPDDLRAKPHAACAGERTASLRQHAVAAPCEERQIGRPLDDADRTALVWVESTGVCFQSLARRSRYSIRPLKFECDCFLTQNAFSGTGTARQLGPTPRGRLKFGRMLACRTRTARNRRVKDARRSVAGPLSAASARYLPIGDSDFGAVKARFLATAR